MRNPKVVESIAETKANLTELVLVAVCLAFGVSLICNFITIYFEQKIIVGICMGACISIISIGYLVFKYPARTNASFDIECTFYITKEENPMAIVIPRYDLSEELKTYLNAAFVE